MDAKGLPLPATVFERYMQLDDRPSHPMQSFLEVDLQGDLPVEALRQALPAALGRHPLLSSRLRRTNARNCHWESLTTPIDVQLLAPGEAPSSKPSLNLEQEPGLRIWVRPGQDGPTVILLVHHATSDALGMLTFFMEWLLLATGQMHRLPENTLADLSTREDLTEIPAAFPRRQRWRNIVRYLFGKPPIALAIPDQKQVPAMPVEASSYEVIRFSEEELHELKQAARSCRCSLNDVLTAALFRTIQDWDREFRSLPSQHPWRVLIPVNRRTPGQQFLSACNLIGYKMLTRDAGQTASFPALLASIREEMIPVRKHPRGVHSFLKTLRFFNKFGLLNRTIRKYDCFATVILSNLGDLGRYFAPLTGCDGKLLTFGPVRLKAIRCAPPRRPYTHLTIVAMTYCDELQLIASRDSPGLNSLQTLDFLQRFRDVTLRSIQELSEGESPETSPLPMVKDNSLTG